MGYGYDSIGNQSAMSAAFGGGVSKIVAFTATYPYQVIKSRLQQGQALDVGITSSAFKEKYSGTIDCGIQILRSVHMLVLQFALHSLSLQPS
jgi:hypothetical protein